MSYYCLIRKLKPKHIVEIGSGFSTLVALEAIEKNGTGSVTCIEPYPREFLKNNPKVKLIEKVAQDITPEFLNEMLEEGDFLFIDSTHTVKVGSDCLHIYLRLLPQIAKDIFVHCHDIFLPYGLHKDWVLDLHRYWTEQYLLYAFLLDNHKVAVLYGSHVGAEEFPELMEEFMGGKSAIGGGSFWFKYYGAR